MDSGEVDYVAGVIGDVYMHVWILLSTVLTTA